MVYDFVKRDCARESQDYNVTVSHDGMAKTYPPGVQQGSAVGSATLACVISEDEKEGYDSIQEGVDMGYGATLLVCPGAYRENVAVERSLTIRSLEGPSKTTMQASNARQPAFGVTATNVTLQGLTVAGAAASWGVRADAGIAVDVRDAIVTGNGSGGIFMQESARIVSISDITVENNGGPGIVCISCEGGLALKNVKVRNNRGGAEADGIGAPWTIVTLLGSGNEIANNGRHGIYAESSKVAIGSRMEIHDNGGWGILCNNCAPLEIPNGANIYKNKLGGIWAVGGITGRDLAAELNGGPGIVAIGNVTLEKVRASYNQGHGIDADYGLVNIGGADNRIVENGGWGLWADQAALQMVNTWLFKNGSGGILAGTTLIANNIQVEGSYGPGVALAGDLAQLSNVAISLNKGPGIHAPFGHVIIAGVNNEIYRNGTWGILAESGSVSFQNVQISDNGWTGVGSINGPIVGANFTIVSNKGDGILAAGSQTTLRSGQIRQNQGWGVVVVGGVLNQQQVEISGNGRGGINFATEYGVSAWAAQSAASIGELGRRPAIAGSSSAGAQIRQSWLVNNGGDAIRFQAGVTPTVVANTIQGNTGYGINNLAPAVTIGAQGNWWGDPSGPGGAGPGRGDEITGTVAYTPWLTAPVSLVMASASDPVFAARGVTASTRIYLQDWIHPTSTVTLTIRDTQGWLHGPLSVTTALTGTGAVVPITFTVPAGAPLGATDHVTVTAVSGSDPAARDTAAFQIVAALLADLAVDKWRDLPVVAPGEPLTYTITVANRGPDAAAQVVLTDTLPLTVTFGSATPSQGTCQGRGPVVCALGPLPPAGAVTVTLVITPSATGSVENIAVAMAGELDPQPWNNAGAVTTEVRIAPRLIYLPLALRR